MQEYNLKPLALLNLEATKDLILSFNRVIGSKICIYLRRDGRAWMQSVELTSAQPNFGSTTHRKIKKIAPKPP